MVSNDLLLHVHYRDIPFAGITIIVVGDILQLPPDKATAEYKSDWMNFAPLWEFFKIAELTEVMRQCGDVEFIDLLNHICVADLHNCDLEILKSKFISTNSVNYPRNSLHIFA